MSNKDKTIDPLPDSFETEEQAGAFWDTHSTVDYHQHLEAADDAIEISERSFEIREFDHTKIKSMALIEPETFRFIKLGSKGTWEKSCIEEEGTIRLGYESPLHENSMAGD